MPRIFISYRRDDSAGHAGRLYDRLRGHFGANRVFMDVTGIEAGTDFVEAIDTAVGGCDVLVAVIGRQWLKCTDGAGHRRLEDPHDFICLEVGSALKRKVRVVPVLVEGAAMPGPNDLPERLQGLTRRQAVELRDTRWDADVEDLIAALARIPEGGGAEPVPPPRPAPSPPPTPDGQGAAADSAGVRLPKAWLGAGLAAVALLLLGLWLGQRGGPETPPAPSPEPVTPALSTAGGGETVPEPAPVAPAATPDAEPTLPPSRPAQPVKPETRRPGVASEAQPALPARRARPVAGSRAPAEDTQSPASAPASTPPLREEPIRAPIVSAAPQVQPVHKPSLSARPARSVTRVAVVAWGKPSNRSFWARQQAGPYSERMAGLFAQVLRARLPEGVDVRQMAVEGYARGITQEQSSEQVRRLCQEAAVAWVFAAMAEEPFAISPADSAFWPELRLAAARCASPDPTQVKEQLAPRQGEDFPFASDMRAAMQRFAREHARLDDQ